MRNETIEQTDSRELDAMLYRPSKEDVRKEHQAEMTRLGLRFNPRLPTVRQPKSMPGQRELFNE